MMGSRQDGFTYLFMLMALTVLSIMLLKNQDSVQTLHRQQQEEELLFRGEQIRQAISRYQSAPYANGCYPTNIGQLLEDRRGPGVNHHLRRWYSDPLTGRAEWGMIYDPQGRWTGVYSHSHGRPLRKEGFSAEADITRFKKAKSYAEWKFFVASDLSAPLPSACNGFGKKAEK